MEECVKQTTFVGIGALVVFGAALGAGCSAQPQGFDVGSFGPNGGNPGNTTTGAASSSVDGGASSGLPCDVEQYLAANCQSCHGYYLSGGAPSPLVTYADLTGKDIRDATKTTAEESVLRMQSATAPMPPGAHPAASDIAILQSWISAGYPMGSCASAGGGGGGDGGSGSGSPLANGPSVCTSGAHWSSGTGLAMRPGEACIACHSSSGAAHYAIAGTVYATAHEPNDCDGVNGGAQVIITDATGKDIPITVNGAGNFYYGAAIATPYKARVVANGKTRAMATPQTNGDCNACHTETGASGAPGRVAIP
jgi:hypothetical protein